MSIVLRATLRYTHPIAQLQLALRDPTGANGVVRFATAYAPTRSLEAGYEICLIIASCSNTWDIAGCGKRGEFGEVEKHV